MSDFVSMLAVWAVMAAIIGVPVALAWWLSDGFADWHVIENAAPTCLPYRTMASPNAPGGVEMVPVDQFTGLPIRYPG